MDKDQLDLELKQFKYHVFSLKRCEEELAEIADLLSGDVTSPSLDKVDAGKVSVKVYKDHLAHLIFKEQELIDMRDYHLYAVTRVRKFLMKLNDEQLELIEMRYWYGHKIRWIAQFMNYSPSVVYEKIQFILDISEHVR